MERFKFDRIPLRKIEGRMLAAEELVEGIEDQMNSAAKGIDDRGECFERLCILTEIIALLQPDLPGTLEFSSTWHWNWYRMKLTYSIDNSIKETVLIHKHLRSEGWRLQKHHPVEKDKDTMSLSFHFQRDDKDGKHLHSLELMIKPGPNAICQKVKVGEKVLPEKTVEERTVDVHEIQCEGAGDFAKIFNEKELPSVEELTGDEGILDENNE